MTSPLDQTDHRPYPLASGPWVMHQTWRELLFAHWTVPIDFLRTAIPPSLDVDTFDGQAWLGIVPFRMTGVRPRFVPSVPGLSAFPELNVRTYVVRDGKPGVWFFSLEAANPIAVAIARGMFHLPYFNADMICDRQPDGTIQYRSERTHRNAPPAEFRGSYGPTGDVYLSKPGTLEAWLTERYCLYASAGTNLYRGEIHHLQWPLQPAEAQIEINTMAAAADLTLPDVVPLLHYVHDIDVVVWPLEKLA